MGQRTFERYLDSLSGAGDAEQPLRTSLLGAANVDPDAYARDVSLGKKAGLHPEFVQEIPDEARERALLGSPIVNSLLKRAPRTAKFLSDHDNAKVAHDDIEALAGIETLIGSPEFSQGVWDAPKAFVRGLRSAPSRMSAGLAETGDILFTPFLRAGAELTGSELLAELARAPREATEFWRKRAETIAGKPEGTLASYAGQIGESVGSSVLSLPFGLAGQGAALAMFGLGSEGGYRKYTDAGYDETYSALLALSTKAMEGITEKMGLDVLYNPEKIARPVFKQVLTFLAGELGGEELNTLWNAAKDKLTLHPEMTLPDVAAQVVDTAIVTIGAAGAHGLAGHAVARTADRLNMNATAKRNRMLMEALGSAAGNSKLLKRLPEKAREFVEAVTADGPLQTVSVPVDAWATYFQEKGIDPAQVAAQTTGSTTAYQEALATGSDLVLPLSGYVARIAGTEHHAGLIDDLRLRPGDSTPREARVFRETQEEQIVQLVAQAQIEEAPRPEEGVYQDVFEKLTAAGRDPSVAQREATLTQSVFRSLGARAGVDPLELYQRYGLEITGPARTAGIPTDVSATTEAIRGSQAWKDLSLEAVEKKFKGKKFEGETPLLERLSKMGRMLASGAELRGLNAWENGLMSLFTTKQTGAKGKTLNWDVAVRTLAEEGYLAEDASLDDLVEAILSDREAKNTGGIRLTPGGVTDYEIEREAARRGYFQDAPPPAEHGDYQGWKYNGEYEDTGIHQYTDHDPNSPTFRDTIAVKAPQDLPAKIAQKQRQRARSGILPGVTPSEGPGKKEPAGTKPLQPAGGEDYASSINDITGISERDRDLAEELLDNGARITPDGKVRLYHRTTEGNAEVIRKTGKMTGKEDGIFFSTAPTGQAESFGTALVEFHVPLSRIEIDDAFGGEAHVRIPLKRAGQYISVREYLPRPDLSGAPEGGASVRFEQSQKDKRGFLRISPDRKIQIGLLERADLSTFLHETGHFYLEVLRDLAKAEGAAEQVRADFDTLTRWLGIEGLEAGATIPSEAQEKFAKAFEAYLFEGKAPSVELQSAFARFKAWLIQIYRDIKALDVRLNDDVRGVFDRLVATDEEIAFARQMTGQKPIFATAEDAGMTQAEFAAYRKVAEEASEKAREDLERSLIHEITRERSKWWVEEYSALKAEVEEEAKKNPVFQAIQLLTRGELFDGTAPPQPVKLSKAALVEMYGKEFLKTLPRGKGYIYSAKGGMHPDVVAEMFGFSSGDEMISKISSAPTMKAWVEDQAHRRMKERHGDMQAEGTIGEEALRAVHTDASGQVLRAELRAIKRLQAKARPALRAEKAQARTERLAMEASIPPVSVFRENARKIIGEKKVLEILPHIYVRAEAKAGKAAEEALARQDFATAGEEKQRQLLNHFLYAEAKRAREDADKILSHMQQLTKKAAQVRLGKAGFGYLDQVNGILERYEFKPIPTTQLRRRESLLEWARRQQEQGLEPSIPDSVLFDARQVNYRMLSIENLRAVRDAVKTIEHLAMIQNQLLGEHAAISFDAARGDLLGALTAHVGEGKTPPLDPETRNWVEKMSDTFGRFDASLSKAEQLFDWFDAGDVTGPWQTYLFRPIAEAQAKEADLSRRYTEKILAIFETYAKAKGSKVLAERVFIEGIGESMTRGALLSVALNTGNEGNYFKLTQGHGWFDAHVEEMLSHLDGSDWAFVQSVWDEIESLWPEIKALEERLTGIAPAKVQAREITNEHGTFRGGYYPVVYDSRFSKAGEKQEDARAERLFEGSYVRATTEKGHTKARADEVARPILLSLEVIPQHVAGVIHDLAFREPIVQANRLLNDARVRAGVIEAMGQTYHSGLNKWLASIANDRNVDRTGIEFWTRFMGWLRTNATIVSMGFKATTTISQVVGFTMSLDLVKGKYLGNAMRKFARNPFEATAWVREKSGEMRHRFDTMDRDVRDGIRKLQAKKGPLSWIQGKAFWGIGVFDAIVSVPTWMGAYEQALAEGLADKDAIAAADKAVRLSQGSGGAKDLAAVQRNSEYMKLFTMFYSYFSALYSRQRHAVREFRTTRDEKDLGARIGALAWRSFLLVIIPATVQELLVARGPDDDEDPAWWAIKKVLAYPFMTIPFARDLVNALEFGRDYQMTPVAQAFDTTVRLARKAEQVAAGDRDPEDLLFPLIDIGGYAAGLPTAQAKITARYIWDVYSGEEEVEDGGAFIRDLMFTRKRK